MNSCTTSIFRDNVLRGSSSTSGSQGVSGPSLPTSQRKSLKHFTRLKQKPRSHQSIKLSGGEGYRLRVVRPGRSSCIVSSITEKPIDSPAETMQRSPAQGGQQAHRPSSYRAVPMSAHEPGHHGWKNLSGFLHRREEQGRMRARLGKWGDPSGQRRKSYNTVGKTQPRLRIRGIIPQKPPVSIPSRPGIAICI